MLTLAALVLATGSAAPVAPVPKDLPAPPKLIGTWKLVKSTNGSEQLTKLEVDFLPDGKMVIRQWNEGFPVNVYEGTYKFENGRVPYVMKIGDAEKKETLTVKKLTADELSLVDPDDIQEDFQRVKPTKKEPEMKAPQK